jgi:hypothetical protein
LSGPWFPAHAAGSPAEARSDAGRAAGSPPTLPESGPAGGQATLGSTLIPPLPDPIAEGWRRALADSSDSAVAVPVRSDSSRYLRAWERPNTVASTTIFEKLPGNPVLPLGKKGSPDTGHAEYPSVVVVGDLIWMFYAAYGPRHRWEIAAAVSADGIDWDKLGVVFAPDTTAGAWDSASLGFPCVIHAPDAPPEERFRMWYAGKGGDLYEGIGLATSANGHDWRRRGRVMARGERGSWDGAQLVDPAVVAVDGGYRMYYCGSRSADGLFALGLAISADGQNWVKLPDNPIHTSRGRGLYTIDVIRSPAPTPPADLSSSPPTDDGGFILFLSAPNSDREYEIHAIPSEDGLDFDSGRSRLVLEPSRDNTWDDKMVYGMEVLPLGDYVYLWFNGIYAARVTSGGEVGLARAERGLLAGLLSSQ